MAAATYLRSLAAAVFAVALMLGLLAGPALAQDQLWIYGQDDQDECIEIDLNSASEEELHDVHQIDVERAPDLIDNRPYDSIDQLDRVDGIAEVRLGEIVERHEACETEHGPAGGEEPPVDEGGDVDEVDDEENGADEEIENGVDEEEEVDSVEAPVGAVDAGAGGAADAGLGATPWLLAGAAGALTFGAFAALVRRRLTE